MNQLQEAVKSLCVVLWCLQVDFELLGDALNSTDGVPDRGLLSLLK